MVVVQRKRWTEHGFRTGHSVTTAAIEFVESIIKSIESGRKVVGIFMDLSKAFNSVSHVTLLNKLSAIGISDIPLTWFKSYLSNRKNLLKCHL